MMQCFSKNILLISLVFLVNFSSAQNPEEDLRKMVEKYQSLDHYSMDMEVYSFQNEDHDGKRYLTATVKKRNNKYYSKTDDYEMIVNGTRLLSIDHELKEIVIGKAEDTDQMKKEIPQFSIDSLYAQGGQLEYMGQFGNLSGYKMTVPNSMIKVYEIYIDANSLLHRLVYHYQSLPNIESTFSKVEVFYKNIDLSPPANSFFKEQKYIGNQKKGRIEPTFAFRNYKVSIEDYDTWPDR